MGDWRGNPPKYKIEEQGAVRLGDFMKIAVFRFALSGGKSVLKVRKNMDKFSRKTRSFVSYSTTSTQA